MPQQEGGRRSDIVEQLRELGTNLERVIRSALESDTGREIQDQFSAGIKELSVQVDKAVESARTSESVQNLGEQAREAWRSAVGDESASQLREGISDALRSLNERINHLLETTPGSATSDEEAEGDPEG